MKITYEGSLHCRLVHEPSGTVIFTDAPKDNMGRGESFSPTDLTAASLGACMMTLMGIYAQRIGIALEGTTIEVSKEMAQEPRRIQKIQVTVSMVKGIPEKQRKLLEKAALTCPVHKSLHPEIEIPVSFQYPD